MTADPQPRVLVLMATYNGGPWLAEQIQSILNQSDVMVEVRISDDGSTDDTLLIANGFQRDPRISVVSTGRVHGSAARNFFHLLEHLPSDGFTHVALADQDDVWHSDKLRKAIDAMNDHQVAAVSTNVTAFWADGRQKLVRKDQRPGKWNHFFESAGPGCSYVVKLGVAIGLASELRRRPDLANRIDFHDWLIYAWVRSQGHRWWVDSWASMHYRQHERNVFGAHTGWRTSWKRWQLLRSGWYREQVLLTADFCGAIEHPSCMHRLRRFGILDRLILASQVKHMRKKRVDRFALAIAWLFGAKAP